jgi:hemoglobin
MNRLVPIALALLICGSALADGHMEQTLYKRLGGYDAIAAVTDDFIGRMAADKSLQKFFVGHSKESLGRIRQLVVDQLCAATGGPCIYIGRDMKSSHQGMGISESDWNAAVAHLVATLDKFKVPEREKKEVLGAVSGFKNDIVEQKQAKK